MATSTGVIERTGYRGVTDTTRATAPIARIRSIDVVRGAVIVLMAIDHVRVYSGVPAAGPTAGVFFTRWVTHFCAPAFAFLAGTSAFLYGRARGDTSVLRQHLVQRGLILVALELTFLHVAWTFGFDYSTVLAGVLWMLGWCMVLLGACVALSPAVIGWVGVAIMVLQTLMRPLAQTLPSAQVLWQFLYLGGLARVGSVNVIVLYNMVPWIGVMMAGYGFGTIMVRSPAERDRLCVRIGLAATACFLVIGGAIALRSDSNQPFLFRLLGQNKYRDSQIFLLMTLGPTLAVLPYANRARSWAANALATYGRVPLFAYLLHIPLIHALALLTWRVRDGSAHAGWFANAPYVELPPNQRWSLPLLYLVFAIAVALVYPACRWYEGVKSRHRESFLKFI